MHGKGIPPEVIGGVVAGVVVLLFLIFVYRILLRICRPNEILIFSGGKHRTEDGRSVGYRVVFGGRGVVNPLTERVSRMDVSLIAVPIAVQGAYSEGGIPLNVQGVANVKVSSKTEQLANAVERFLGMNRDQIMAIARETLEGNLRGVLSTLTPEEVNTDREMFAGELLHEADHALARLGLELDTLKIQHVSDDKGYLGSIGRRSTAELFKRSRLAEASADLDVQRARLAQVRFQLIADKVRPAEAKKAQMVQQAKGAASMIFEDGKATAAAIRSLGEPWAKAGASARQIFVAQQLQALVGTMMDTVGDMPIDKVPVLAT